MARKPRKPARIRAYERTEHDASAITPYEAECIQEAFDYLNESLFAGALPDAFIRYETKANSDGYYSPNGFSGRSGEFGKDAITLNADRFVGRTDKQILAVLGHNLCHHWQRHCDAEPKRHYHDENWSAKMVEIGLQPSSSGEVGGKVTGQHMSQYIIPDGPFEQACDKLIATGWALNLQSTPRPGPKVKKDPSKAPFICPACTSPKKFWGKPSSRWVCPECGCLAILEGADVSASDVIRFRLVQVDEASAAMPIDAPAPDASYATKQAVKEATLIEEPVKQKRGRPPGNKNKKAAPSYEPKPQHETEHPPVSDFAAHTARAEGRGHALEDSWRGVGGGTTAFENSCERCGETFVLFWNEDGKPICVIEPCSPELKRGRPKGSKNNAKPVAAATYDQTPKRKRGRPKGSKNKPKGMDAGFTSAS